MLAIIILVGFIALQLGVGIFVSRFIKTADDFYVAGRKQGSLVITFSLFATWFGSESCLSAAGRVSEHGLSAAKADPIAYTFCLLIYGFFLARPLWSQKVVSIGSVIGDRFGKSAEMITGLILAVTSLLWAAGQVRAFGHVLSMHLQLDFVVAIIAATSVAVIYTSFGGLLADMYTDLIQGMVLIAGLLLLAFIVFTQIPGFHPLDVLFNLPTDRASLVSPDISMSSNIELWLVPIAGSLISQELVVRMSGSQNSQIAAKSSIMAAFLYLFIGLIPVVLGLLAPYLISKVNHGDDTLLVLAHQYLPYFMSIIFSAALVSAILSTVDSALLASSTAMTRNVVSRFVDFTRNTKLEIFFARLLVVIGGVVACIFAVSSESIHALVTTASSFGTAGILILFLVGLFTRFGSPQSGLPTLVVGILSTLIFEYAYGLESPYFYSIACSLSCFVMLECYFSLKQKWALAQSCREYS